MAAGNATIQANPADILPAGQVTLYGVDGPIPTNKIEYGAANVTIVRVDSDGDGVTDQEENGAPNGGDGNQDGTADRLQKYVASLRSSPNAPYATIAALPQVTLTNVTGVANPAPGTSPSNVAFPLGFFRFDASGVAAGGATTVTIYAQTGTAINTYYGFGPTPDNATPHWYPFLFNGATGATVYSNRIELRLADGQRGDGDPAAARISFGPAAPGQSPTPWTNPSHPFDLDNDGAVTAADPLVLINLLNASGGPLVLPLVPAAGDSLPPFRDTNRDNLLEAADVLNVINFINSTASGEGERSLAHRAGRVGGRDGGSRAAASANRVPSSDRQPRQGHRSRRSPHPGRVGVDSCRLASCAASSWSLFAAEQGISPIA